MSIPQTTLEVAIQSLTSASEAMDDIPETCDECGDLSSKVSDLLDEFNKHHETITSHD